MNRAIITSKHLRRTLIAGVLAVMVALSLVPAATTHAQGGTHTVQAGENLFRIALNHNMTVEALAAANGITDPTRIYVGQVLVIPDPSAPAAQPVSAAPAPSNPVPVAVNPGTHTIQVGETLASIGRAYGVTWTDIAALNGITNPNQIYAGQQIMIPAGGTVTAAPVTVVLTDQMPAAAAPAPAGTQRTHIVQRGEHLAAIARIYGISWGTIARANNIANPSTIYAGQQLIIPASDDGLGSYASAASHTPAAPTISVGKQVVVDLSDQLVYAYENGQLLRTVLVSTGLPGTPTVQGDYSIYVKYESQTMSGPGYYLPGVPYVMYFYQGYGLHGTYWHSNFGNPMSHGCVNMPTPDAGWFYSWAPVGTPVHVQY